MKFFELTFFFVCTFVGTMSQKPVDRFFRDRAIELKRQFQAQIAALDTLMDLFDKFKLKNEAKKIGEVKANYVKIVELLDSIIEGRADAKTAFKEIIEIYSRQDVIIDEAERDAKYKIRRDGIPFFVKLIYGGKIAKRTLEAIDRVNVFSRPTRYTLLTELKPIL